MTSKVPFVKQETNWLALIPHLLLIGVLTLSCYYFTKNNYVEIAFIIYFIFTRIVRWLFFPKDIYMGMKLLKEAKFEQAIPFFQKTIDFYTKYSWVDRFRFLLLISSSRKTIRESSISNLAYCYLQIGDVERAKKIYMNLLEQYPLNNNAISMLNTINLVSNDAINKNENNNYETNR